MVCNQDMASVQNSDQSGAAENTLGYVPDWALPEGVAALMTHRHGGQSRAPHDTLNLGDHVGDDPVAVAANRRLLCRTLG